jgi:hypothetical protein
VVIGVIMAVINLLNAPTLRWLMTPFLLPPDVSVAQPDLLAVASFSQLTDPVPDQAVQRLPQQSFAAAALPVRPARRLVAAGEAAKLVAELNLRVGEAAGHLHERPPAFVAPEIDFDGLAGRRDQAGKAVRVAPQVGRRQERPDVPIRTPAGCRERRRLAADWVADGSGYS